MQARVKNYGLVVCLFVFLFVIIGGGLHLNPSGAFFAAVSGTPLVIYTFRRWLKGASRPDDAQADTARNEVDYVSSKRGNADS